jgi:hypothetical protein
MAPDNSAGQCTGPAPSLDDGVGSQPGSEHLLPADHGLAVLAKQRLHAQVELGLKRASQRVRHFIAADVEIRVGE